MTDPSLLRVVGWPRTSPNVSKHPLYLNFLKYGSEVIAVY
jgi:hypothetical protein